MYKTGVIFYIIFKYIHIQFSFYSIDDCILKVKSGSEGPNATLVSETGTKIQHFSNVFS